MSKLMNNVRRYLQVKDQASHTITQFLYNSYKCIFTPKNLPQY